MDLIAVIHSRAEAVPALRVFFSVCLGLVLLAGVMVFRKRRELFGQDPDVMADHRAVRNLRLWQVVLVWLLAIELFVTMLWRL